MVLLCAEAARGESLVPRGGPVLLDAWIDEWWRRRRGHPCPRRRSTARAAGSGNHIRPLLGRYTLDELEADTVDRRGLAG